VSSTPSLVDRFALRQGANLILLVMNVAGAVLYVWRASLGWAIPGEETAGEPLLWWLAILPVISVALLINVSWGVVILWRRQWSSGRLWLLVLMVWLVATVVDFAHHGSG
jgi:hypothetical protein